PSFLLLLTLFPLSLIISPTPSILSHPQPAKLVQTFPNFLLPRNLLLPLLLFIIFIIIHFILITKPPQPLSEVPPTFTLHAIPPNQ
ncbi:FHIPEP family type III secretion protein, partial [Bacillus velezensis]|uniref:FHIPEP family type III secretion protein n=1 Tax=Bacillus velezensis TaxID=492670 RepID=UPI0016438A21